jgi:hypothetical protein
VQAHIGAGYPAGSFNSPRESFVKRKRLYQQGFSAKRKSLFQE